MAYTPTELARVAEHIAWRPEEDAVENGEIAELFKELMNLKEVGRKCPHCKAKTGYPVECFHVECPECLESFCFGCAKQYRMPTSKDLEDARAYKYNKCEMEYGHTSRCQNRLRLEYLSREHFVKCDKTGIEFDNRFYYFAGLDGQTDMSVRNPHGQFGEQDGLVVAGLPGKYHWNAEADRRVKKGNSGGYFGDLVPKNHPHYDLEWHGSTLAGEWGNITRLKPYRENALEGIFDQVLNEERRSREEEWWYQRKMFTVAACFTCVARMQEANAIVTSLFNSYKRKGSCCQTSTFKCDARDMYRGVINCIETRRSIEEQVPMAVLKRMQKVDGFRFPPILLFRNGGDHLQSVRYGDVVPESGNVDPKTPRTADVYHCDLDEIQLTMRRCSTGMPFLQHDATPLQRTRAICMYNEVALVGEEDTDEFHTTFLLKMRQ